MGMKKTFMENMAWILKKISNVSNFRQKKKERAWLKNNPV